MLEIKVTKTTTPKAKPDENNLGFGTHYTDHMFRMEYTEGQGWHSPRIEPYQPISLDPAAMVFHYAQESFEGMKAYRTAEGQVQLFRPEKNAERLQSTHERLCIPTIPVEDFVQAVKALVDVDRDWVPSAPGTSLYLRPFTIATEPHLGVKPSATYEFIVIASPSGAYYAEGLDPVKIYVEDEYVRATPGGTGFIKCGGNYAASLAGQMKAHDLGYSQVLWMSCIELLRDWGYTVDCDSRLSIQEVMEAAHAGKLEEVFGTGTAAVVSPVGKLYYEGDEVTVNDGNIGQVTQRLYDTLTGIQWGVLPDEKGWIVKV